jgi:hypothetical protein
LAIQKPQTRGCSSAAWLVLDFQAGGLQFHQAGLLSGPASHWSKIGEGKPLRFQTNNNDI